MSLNRFVIGIDPGQQGSIYLRDNCADNLDVVICETSGEFLESGAKHGFIDIASLILEGTKEFAPIRFIDLFYDLHRYSGSIRASIEHVGDMPKNQGMFRYGEGFMGLKLALTMHGIDYQLYRPQVWKKHYKLSNDKDQSVAKAIEICPELLPHLKTPRGRILDGRAEAFLIAEYGMNPEAKPSRPVPKKIRRSVTRASK